jgi:hypothetical protein
VKERLGRRRPLSARRAPVGGVRLRFFPSLPQRLSLARHTHDNKATFIITTQAPRLVPLRLRYPSNKPKQRESARQLDSNAAR